MITGMIEEEQEDDDIPVGQYVRRDLLRNLVIMAETYELNEHNLSFSDNGYKVSIYIEKENKDDNK